MKIDNQVILGLLDLIVSGVKMIPKARREYDNVRARVQKFIDEGRDPTPEEWAALIAKTKSTSERIKRS